MVRILGAEKVHFSYKNLHPDFMNIVKHLNDQGIVDAWPFYNPSGVDTSRNGGKQKCLVEMNTLTDCFYRVKNLYDFVAVLDFDEVIFPVNEADMSWDDIIRRANSSVYRDAYISSNVFYPEVNGPTLHDIPSYMYMLQHTQRSRLISLPGSSIKSFFGTERVKVLHNHAPHHCLNHKNKCDVIDLPPSISQNSHYRENLEEHFFKRTVPDKAIWKFKDVLIKAVQKTLNDTGFEP